MTIPTSSAGYWFRNFPDYETRMEQINKLFRVLDAAGRRDILTENLSLVPME